jgi:hypothetical protein
MRPSFCSKARMIWRQNITVCSGFEISFNGMKLALHRAHEVLAQTYELAQRSDYYAAQACLRDRTAASQRFIRADCAALLLRPMQVQLSGLRKQSRGPQRRSSSDNWRRKPAAFQCLWRRSLSGARGVRIGGDGSCRDFTSAIAKQTSGARRCRSRRIPPNASLDGEAAAFAASAHPRSRRLRPVEGGLFAPGS